MNREERQQARTDRYRELADNARKQSEQCFRQSESMASVIPMGQPVHGKADRNYREKIWNKMVKSYLRLCRKAQVSDGFSSPNRYLPIF